MKKYYIVTAKCGHVSKGYYIERDFPVIAESGSEASQKVKNYPRVKKQMKNSITKCVEVNIDEYNRQKEENNTDGYLKAKNNKQQRELCPNIHLELVRMQTNSNKRKESNYLYKKKKEKELLESLSNRIKYDTSTFSKWITIKKLVVN